MEQELLDLLRAAYDARARRDHETAYDRLYEAVRRLSDMAFAQQQLIVDLRSELNLLNPPLKPRGEA